jgi:hypothetical protein
MDGSATQARHSLINNLGVNTMPYTYQPGTDGCDSTFDVITPEGEFMVSIHYWEMKADAEARAKLIVDALNAYKPTAGLFDIVKAIVTEHDKVLTHDQIRNRHFENLNDYRNSVEYQVSPNCYQHPSGELKTLIGNRWEIDEAIYWEFLEMLPPMGWKGHAFYMMEFCFDDITTKFSKEGDKYYCEFARYTHRNAA